MKSDFFNERAGKGTVDGTAHYAALLRGTDYSVPKDPIPYGVRYNLLRESRTVGAKSAPNRIVYQPMEGQDADEEGNPTETTAARYRALARGGAGVIWMEAVSVLPEARSNLHQLMITEKNLDAYRRIVENVKEVCLRENGVEPLFVVQLNHSGRFSKPDGKRHPIAAASDPFLDAAAAPETLIADETLASLPECFAANAALCEKVGFDGVDVKCCHGYLFSELLTAKNRPGPYGGCLENRARVLFDSFDACKSALNRAFLACRFGVYDGFPAQTAFGTDPENMEKCDFSEPKKIVEELVRRGLSLLNVTMGSPYLNPWVSRPYRVEARKKGPERLPKTNPLSALSRLFSGAAVFHRAFPDLPVVVTGESGLCGMAPYAAAGLIEADYADFVGFGRMSFAYPEVARDLLNGCFDEKKCCVACSGCSELKKNGLPSGCIVRNPYYRNLYRELIKNDK